MRLQTVRLQDLCISISDGDHQAPPKSNSGIPFITISNITSMNQLDFSSSMFVPRWYYEKLDLKRKAQKNDILYSVVGSFGIPVFMKNSIEFIFQRHIALLRPNIEKIVPQYLYYVMLDRAFYMMADSLALGAAQRTITLSSLRNIEITIPEVEQQQSIVDILSAYDNLIENNQKQIKLLEEAAQRLYKEWFVDLRFPGHENVEIADGVPECWNIGILSDIGTFKRGKTITKAKIVEGEVPVISGGLGPAYYHHESNTSSPVITVSGSGANAGFTRLYYTKVFASDCSFVDIEQTPYLYWIYLFLKNNSSRLDMLQKGSAQPHVYAKDINALECVIPIKEVLNLFCEVVGPYFNKIGILEQQIIRLTESRDRLLPKLMSGEIEV